MELNPEEISIISTALGGLLALLGGIGSSYFLEKWKNDRAEKSLAWAFYGEVSSICKLIRSRKYVEEFREHAIRLRKAETTNRQVMKADYEYFHIFKNNSSSIGILSSEITEKIVSFYVLGTAVLEDIHSLSVGYHNDKSNESISVFFDEISSMFSLMLRQGDELVQLIERKYS